MRAQCRVLFDGDVAHTAVFAENRGCGDAAFTVRAVFVDPDPELPVTFIADCFGAKQTDVNFIFFPTKRA